MALSAEEDVVEKEEGKERAMGSWVAACRLLPSLATRKGFAQAPAVARCPKNQQLYLFILRGYAFIIPFTCLVCEPLGRTSLI